MRRPNVYAKRLDALMKAKRDKLSWPQYYLDKDSNFILRWNLERAKTVWEKIENSTPSGLGSDTCPFCRVYYSFTQGDCLKCTYGKRHGICNRTEGNDFANIPEKGRSGSNLTNAWYKKTMQSIIRRFPLEVEK